MSTFSKLHPLLQTQIVERLGWTSLRPVQELAGEAIFNMKNCIILAPTAGGKTESAFFPVLSELIDISEIGIKAIYLSPIKALLNNIEPRVEVYTSMVGLSHFKWHGDISQGSRNKFIKEPGDVLLTTPESIEVMLVSSKVNKNIFKPLRYIIIDEIHAFAAVDRGIHLLSVLERLKSIIQTDFLRIGLSATVGNPEELLDWMQGSSMNEKILIDPPKKPSKKNITISYIEDSFQLTQEVANHVRQSKSLIFCESRKTAEELGKKFLQLGREVFVHHSSLSLTTRALAEKNFSESQIATILSTSTMELGIDVGDLDNVLQIESSSSVASFLQRLGRTGRRENTIANTHFYVSEGSSLLLSIAIVELAKKGIVESISFKKQCWHIFLHQIMAMCLQWGGVNRTTIWENLHGVSSFSFITKEGMNEFLEELKRDEILFEDNGFLSMGLRAESMFGRRNFMEMYSVLSSIQEFQVLTQGGSEIGKIQQDFAESLFVGVSSFLLAGRAWLVERIDWDKTLVIVSEAPAGKTPLWNSITPRFLSYDICREMREILISSEKYTYLNLSALERLEMKRKETGEFLKSSFAPLEIGSDGITWWTYAGGKINTTLKILFKMETNGEVISSNESIRIEKQGMKLEEFLETLNLFKTTDYFQREDVLRKVQNLVPNFRLSKFQPCLSSNFQKKILAEYILDIKGTQKFLEFVGGIG